MAKNKKTDNHNPGAKLALRRYFLEKYHPDPPHVLDCCQGGGVMWNALKKEFPVASYWGVDVKPKKGRLKLDSVRILAQKGWPQNVVDIDTYGSPFKHWAAMLPNVTRPITVFLTIGQNKMVGGFQGKAPREMMGAIGLGKLAEKCPPTLTAKLWSLGVDCLLARTCDYGIIVVEAVEAVSVGNARYIGVRIEPDKKTPAPESKPPKRAKQSKLAKGASHV